MPVIPKDLVLYTLLFHCHILAIHNFYNVLNLFKNFTTLIYKNCYFIGKLKNNIETMKQTLNT